MADAITSSAGSGTAGKARRLIPILLVAAGVAVYADGFRGTFVFDDMDAIVTNANIRSLWPIGRAMTGPELTSVTGRPVVCLSLAVDYWLGGLDVRWYHATNLAIHLAAGLVLFGLTRRTLNVWSHSRAGGGREGAHISSVTGKTPTPTLPSSSLSSILRPRTEGSLRAEGLSTGGGGKTSRYTDLSWSGGKGSAVGDQPPVADLLAGWIALLWIVHPLQTAAVQYIIQRSECLAGLFLLLTLYCFARAMQSASSPRFWLWCSAAACAIGMGCKETMVTAPLLVLAYDRTFFAGGWIAAARKHRAYYAALAATWMILAALMVGGPRSQSAGFSIGISPIDYATTQLAVIPHYLWLAIWPRTLVLDYAWPIMHGWGTVSLGGAVVIAALVAVTVRGLWRASAVGFLGLWFFAILSVTSSFVPLLDAAFEHRMYLPLAACITVIVVGLWRAVRPIGRVGVMALVGVGILAAGALSVRSAVRNLDYQSRFVAWSKVVTQRPENALARFSLAKVLDEEGNRSGAIDQFKQAVAINPAYFNAVVLLGEDLVAAGRTDEAIDFYRGQVASHPEFTRGWFNLGRLYESRNDLPAAEAALRHATATTNRAPEAHFELGRVLSETGRPEAGMEEFREAMREDPSFVPAAALGVPANR
jgi:tetratricopeptide (TPR) repeat protein